MRNCCLKKFLVLAAAVLLFAWAQPALASIVPAINVGDNLGAAAFTTEHSYNPFFRGWVIGPVSVNYEQAAGAWVKELNGPTWGWPRHGNTYSLLEIIRVGDGPAWNGWHEDIQTTDWNWVKGSVFAYTPVSSANSSGSMPFSLNLSAGTSGLFKGLTLLDKGNIEGGKPALARIP